MAKNQSHIPAHLLHELSQMLSSQMGIHFAEERWRDIERGISTATRDFGFEDAKSCARWLLSSPLTRHQIEVLADHLTVGETYFFRDRQIFEILETHIFPDLIKQRIGSNQSLRVWSAGCASGEEPYSIAMLFRKIIPDIRSWNITVLGSDINPRFIRKAEQGIYTEWSFRDVPPLIKDLYFREKAKGRFEILPDIGRMVSFAYLNLVEDSCPSLFNATNAMDVILLRNVLMYFSPDIQRKVIRKMHGSLVEGGWLIVSPSECANQLFPEFDAINISGFTFFRKDIARSDVAALTLTLPYDHLSERDLFMPTPDACFIPTADINVPVTEAVATDKGDKPGDALKEACILYGQGRYDEMVKEVELSAQMTANGSKQSELVARALANQGKLDEAVRWCEKAVAAAKLDPGSHYLLATILQELGKYDEATTALKRALYLDPDFTIAHFTLGNLARRQGKREEAARYFNNALSLLKMCPPDEILAETDGVTAGSLIEIIENTQGL
jgi:chemotaxis protein methyltransferase CheR